MHIIMQDYTQNRFVHHIHHNTKVTLYSQELALNDQNGAIIVPCGTPCHFLSNAEQQLFQHGVVLIDLSIVMHLKV